LFEVPSPAKPSVAMGLVYKPDIGSKHLDKPNSEPGLTGKAWHDLQLCLGQP